VSAAGNILEEVKEGSALHIGNL